MEKANIDYSKLPTHIAIIMDGNGRWAKKELFHVPWGTGKVPKFLRKLLHFVERSE